MQSTKKWTVLTFVNLETKCWLKWNLNSGFAGMLHKTTYKNKLILFWFVFSTFFHCHQVCYICTLTILISSACTKIMSMINKFSASCSLQHFNPAAISRFNPEEDGFSFDLTFKTLKLLPLYPFPPKKICSHIELSKLLKFEKGDFFEALNNGLVQMFS